MEGLVAVWTRTWCILDVQKSAGTCRACSCSGEGGNERDKKLVCSNAPRIEAGVCATYAIQINVYHTSGLVLVGATSCKIRRDAREHLLV